MNFKNRVLKFNLIFFLILILLSLLYPKINSMHIAGLRAPTILSDVQHDTSIKNGLTQEQRHNLEERKAGKTVIKDYLSDSGLINASGNHVALQGFFSKLSALKKDKTKKVRIAYFGDSFIEGDLITMDVREKLQQNFGGTGVGFVGVTSITAGFRTSITHGFSNGWNDVSFKSDERKNTDLFLSGHAYFSAGDNEVNYRSVTHPLLDSFSHMEVLYGMPANKSSLLQLNINGASQTFKPESAFNSTDVLLQNKKIAEIHSGSSDVPLYGFSFEGAGGVVLDNFSFRGISGVELDNFNNNLLTEVNKKRHYDLVILQYGPNLLFKPELVDFSWYRKKMQPILKRLKAMFPETDFLLVSTADKGSRYGGEWQTQKGVEPLVDVQYEMAQGEGLDFFNLYHAMGGNGQIVKWATETPSLANKDYTHVNGRGAKQIANYLFTAIMNEYNAYDKSAH